jgi:chromosome segregation protein
MTRLLALELFGFKSFADRTRFEFPEGITVVVGPNGSGKSNVVDAIKWVLGEQSVRSLRGKEMTDVIFAGSAGRKPLNYAEVSLVFDNAAGDLGVATPEVQIMRRVTRDGESEYLVNGETARLRDIREIFSGTGAATQAYSVIEQGRVDALLVASGRERRGVFEEAAGITRFRARRTEALRRLERAEQNRQRLADIVGEVAARLETVRHQAARARRWRQMTDRLRHLRLAAAGRDLADVDAIVTAVDTELQETRARLAEAEGRAASAAAEAETLAGESLRLQPAAATARTALAGATQRAAAAEAAVELARSRRGDLERDCERAETVLRQALAAARVAADAVAVATGEAERLETRAADVAARLATCARAADGSHHEAADHRRRLTEALATLERQREELVRLETLRDRADERAEAAATAAAVTREAVETARAEVARLTEAEAASAGHLASLATRLDSAANDIESLETSQRRTQAALQSAWHDLSTCTAKLEACRERQEVLRDVVTRHEGLSEAARQLLASTDAAIPGLTGTVADLLVADETWAAAVDAALGDLGQGIVVGSLADTLRWHAAWAAGPAAREVLAAGGRIRLVAAADLPALPAFDPTGTGGVVGRLDRLLPDPPTSAADAALREALLGRIWVVERLDAALPLMAEAPPQAIFLSRDGGCLTATGILEIGTPAAATGLVARRSELRGLGRREEELAAAVVTARGTIDTLEAEATDLEAAVREARARRQEIAETLAASRTERDRTGSDRRRADAAVAAAEEDLHEADRRCLAAVAAARDAAAAVSPLVAAVAAGRAEVAAAETAIHDLERSRGEVVDEMQRLRVEEATTAEKLARGRDAVARLRAALEDRHAEVRAARQTAETGREVLARHDLDTLAAGSQRAETAVALERAAASVVRLDRTAADVDLRRRQAGTAVETARSAATRLAEAVHRHEMEAGEARHRRVRIVERIRDEYDIDISGGLPAASGIGPADGDTVGDVPEDRTVLEQEIETLRKRLASMTTVNLEALAESEELATRLTTLESQLADVTDAKASIEALITRIDDESRRLLGDTIATVRGYFREMFERLFGGGQADIVLEEGVDLLETSVDIVARPPGKEPRNISLLSGGEKTMTCVALLLAIFRSRPSPFCVLDEVDAALDEANVDRFVGVLRDFLSATQFIVVTHSKKTMAAATTLYGVTQEESGVSKRVAVRFERAAAAARPANRAA